MLFKRLIILTILAASLSCAVADEIMFSGNSNARWIARSYRAEQTDMFDVYRSEPGRPFEPMLEQYKGKLEAIQAVGKTLRVIYDERFSGIVTDDGSFMVTMNLPGKMLAVCESPDPQDGRNELMVLVEAVADAAQKSSASSGGQPAGGMRLYRSRGSEFLAASSVRTVQLSGGFSRADMVQAGGKVYVFLTGKKGFSIGTWSAFDGWKKLPQLKEKPLDILSMDSGVFLVFSQKVEGGADRELRLAKLSSDGKPGMLMPIVDPGTKKALTWPLDAKMDFSVLGTEAGICWKGRINREFLTFNDKAQAGKSQTIDDLLRASSRLQRVARVQQYFTIAIISAGFAVMFLLKPYVTSPRILMLPPTLKPANLIRRVIALLVDLLIVQIPVSIGVNYYLISVRGMDRDRVLDMLKDHPDRLLETCPELLYFGMALIVIIAVYGTAMEMFCGWTLGKKLMGLRVVTDDAIKPPLREAALRNIFKIVALVSLAPAANLELYFVLLIIVMIVTRYRQRIGDMVARTVVVEVALPSEQQQQQQIQPPAQQDRED